MVDEPVAESGTEPDTEHGAERVWLPVAEAARALGVTEQAIRRRMGRGTLETRREVDGNRVRTLVAVAVTNPRAERSTEPVANPVAEPDQTVTELREQVARLEERLAAAAALESELRRQAEEIRAAFRERIAELKADLERERRRAEEAERRQAERDRQIDEVLHRLAERHRPWPGLRIWWRRFWEGEG
jgi:chromosome segregation ATPase